MCVRLQTLLQVVASYCVLLGVVAQFETGQTLQLLILLSCCVRLRVAYPSSPTAIYLVISDNMVLV